MKGLFVFILLLLQIAIVASGQRSDTFNVYFDRNDAVLNQKGNELINQLIADSALVRGQKIMLLGYADYIGSNVHNYSLSASRAKNVADYLIKTGFSKKDITLCAGRGKIDRAPVGKDGYSQDRKVQIVAKHEKVAATTTAATNAAHSFPDIEMVKVTGGDFHFAFGKYDITQAQWLAVMGGTHPGFKDCDSCPVILVSWMDVKDFLKKLNNLSGKQYRLPTEAEWRFAAKGGNKTHNYIYAGSNDINQVAWYDGNSGNRTHPVGQKQPNELGIYDMSGNVWQFCRKSDTSIDDRVIHGGAWFIRGLSSRVDYRSPQFMGNTERTDAVGFRVAYSL
jgi:hypothetical protein